MSFVTPEQMRPFYPAKNIEKLANGINQILTTCSPEVAWKTLSKPPYLSPAIPFEWHLMLFSLCYPEWEISPDTAPAFIPDPDTGTTSHLAECMRETGCHSVDAFHAWSISDPDRFWKFMIKKLGVVFSKKPNIFCDTTQGNEYPNWLPNAKFNIIDSCFKANPDETAIIQHTTQGPLHYFSFRDLNNLSNQVANSLVHIGFKPLDPIAIAMPMHFQAVAIYLGIIKMGGVVVSIADSFSSDEMALRMDITKSQCIFTQDFILRDGKTHPLYEKVAKTTVPLAIILPADKMNGKLHRKQDMLWDDFLKDNTDFHSYQMDAKTPCNILFSSGTTGIPKAIPWTHATPIKAASDAFLHQDIHPRDILAWPTNLGWMMGPWLIFAAFINKASIALYDDVPCTRAFGQFVQDAKVTMLGVVPTLVATWRQSGYMKNLDWHRIKCFSSTGECSNPKDMLYLMHLAGYKPVIEYCGGTEIGGAYISGTMLQNNYPTLFSTKAFGLDFVLLDEKNHLTNHGEVALIPPSIGLSLNLLNADHHKTYFSDMPTLSDGKIVRRHGDLLQQFPSGYYSVLGRADDTMNLGGIKISSAEIERVLAGTENITETAAIATTANHSGPARLVIFAVTHMDPDRENIKKILQEKINAHLNPLFKISDVVFVQELPKTASNKIMRRVLREKYYSVNKK